MAHLLLRADGNDHTVEFEGTGEEFLVEFAILTGQVLADSPVPRETFLKWVRSDEFREILEFMDTEATELFMDTEATELHIKRKGGKREKKDTCYRCRRPVKRRQV